MTNKLKKIVHQYPIIGYLNTDSQLTDVYRNASLELLCIDETKLHASFADVQFHIEGYQYPPFRRDCDKNGAGKMIIITRKMLSEISIQTFQLKKRFEKLLI